MRRIDCAVTLLPQPLSPTMPSVFPGNTSKVAPSTALVVPSSWKKRVQRFLTESNGFVAFCMDDRLAYPVATDTDRPRPGSRRP